MLITLTLPTEQSMLDLAAKIATLTSGGLKIYLQGELGAGKTTFARGFLRGLGFTGTVKSPTFTFVESYKIADRYIYHFDLYRLGHTEELEFLGVRDYFADDAICLVEWPENAGDVLPKPDLTCYIAQSEGGRLVNLESASPIGKTLLTKLMNK